MRYIGFLLALICIALLLMSCWEDDEYYTYEHHFLAISNIDGTETEYICERFGSAYFIPDPDNPEQECILNGFVLLNLDGSVRRTLLDPQTYDVDDEDIAISSDKTRLAFVYNGNLCLFDIATSNLTQITQGESLIKHFVFSPSGDRIAYTRINLEDHISQLVNRHIVSGETDVLCEIDNDEAYFQDVAYGQDDNIYFIFKEYAVSLTGSVCKANLDNVQCYTLFQCEYPYQLSYIEQRNVIAIHSSDYIILYDLESPHLTYLNLDSWTTSRMIVSPNGKYLSCGSNIFNLDTTECYKMSSESWIDFSSDGIHVIRAVVLDYDTNGHLVTQ